MDHRTALAAARRHLDELRAAERSYLDSVPYRLVHAYDPRAARYTVKVEVTQPLPPEIAALTVTILEHTRGALDALASALAGGAAPSIRFPIFSSLQSFAQRSRKAIAGMSDSAQAAIEALQPYHNVGGWVGHPLWTLSELLAVLPPRFAAGAFADGTLLGVNTRRHVALGEVPLPSERPFEDGTTVVNLGATVAGPDPKLDMYLTARYALAFAAATPARGAHVVDLLAGLLDHVEDVVLARLEPELPAR